MDKAIIGILLIAVIAIVSVTSLAYYVAVQTDQTQNTLSPTPFPEPTQSPNEEPTEPASIPKPSVPEFTLKLADRSTIDIIFRNQQFPATIDGNPTVLYYDIAIKPHSIEDWWGPYDKGWFPAETDSEFTTISFPRNEYPDGPQLDFRAQVYLGYHYNYTDYSLMYPIPQTQSSFACSASDWSETQTITLP